MEIILNEKVNIDTFINYNRKKKIVVVQGLGFVGAVMAIVVANSANNEYAVIGIEFANKDSQLLMN